MTAAQEARLEETIAYLTELRSLSHGSSYWYGYRAALALSIKMIRDVFPAPPNPPTTEEK